MSKILNAADILGASDLQLKEVEVPEWDGAVKFKPFTGKDRDGFEAYMAANNEAVKEGKETRKRWAIVLLMLTLVDASGVRLFTDDQFDAFYTKNAEVLERLSIIAMELNGYLPRALETAVKNSESDQSEDSGSSSPEPSEDAQSENSSSE